MVCRTLLNLECICRTSPFLLASECKARRGLGNDGTCLCNGSRAMGVGVLRETYHNACMVSPSYLEHRRKKSSYIQIPCWYDFCSLVSCGGRTSFLHKGCPSLCIGHICRDNFLDVKVYQSTPMLCHSHIVGLKSFSMTWCS